jgi:ABC-type Fe3+/spermidine/putrescine transport system ATPase subunit
MWFNRSRCYTGKNRTKGRRTRCKKHSYKLVAFWILKMTIENIQQRIDQLKYDAALANRLLSAEQIAYRRAKHHLRDMEEAQSIAQQVAQAVQEQAHAKIAGVVSTCLRSVFGSEAYGFKINFERKRGKTEAQLVLIKNGEEIPDPANEDSGGVTQVAAFALRLACLVLALPRLRRLLVLDEPFSHVSAEYRPAIRSMIRQLSQDFGVQFIIVTHEPEYMMGKVVKM